MVKILIQLMIALFYFAQFTCHAQERYLSIKPIIFGKFNNIGNSVETEIFAFGLNIGQGVAIKKHRFGIDLSYDKVYYKLYSDRSHTFLKFEYQYSFYNFKKINLFVSFQPQLLLFQYTPELNGFQYYNDPVDNKVKKHMLGIININTGIDIRLKLKYHVIFGLGYQNYITNKSGKGLPNIPINIRFDFRTPFPKLLMHKNSKTKNYY